MKIKFIILFLVMVGVLLPSCKKNEVAVDIVENIENTDDLGIPTRDLTYLEIEEIEKRKFGEIKPANNEFLLIFPQYGNCFPEEMLEKAKECLITSDAYKRVYDICTNTTIDTKEQLFDVDGKLLMYTFDSCVGDYNYDGNMEGFVVLTLPNTHTESDLFGDRTYFLVYINDEGDAEIIKQTYDCAIIDILDYGDLGHVNITETVYYITEEAPNGICENVSTIYTTINKTPEEVYKSTKDIIAKRDNVLTDGNLKIVFDRDKQTYIGT